MDREFEWAEIEPASEIVLRKGERLVDRDTGFAVRGRGLSGGRGAWVRGRRWCV